MWWTFMQDLKTFLDGYGDLSGTTIGYGPSNPMPEVDTIEIRKGPGGAVDLSCANKEAQIVIWLDLWTKDETINANGKLDQEPGYAKLAVLDGKTMAALKAWIKNNGISQAFIAKVSSMDPDGDLFRPHIGARIVLDIRVRGE